MRRDKSTEKKMNNACILLQNAQAENIKAAISAWGYDDERFAQGRTLYHNAQNMIEARKNKYARQILATQTLNKKAEEVKRRFADIVTMTRRIYIDEGNIIQDLGIKGPRERKFQLWIAQANTFYKMLSYREILERFLTYGICVEDIKEQLTALEELRKLKIDQGNAIGNAMVATERKDAAIKALFKWCNVLMTVCRIVFSEKPEIIERLQPSLIKK